MSARVKLIKARLGMLVLAKELQNISLACRRAGISRSHFCEIKEAFEKWGAVETTLNRYVHAIPESLRRALDGVAAILFPNLSRKKKASELTNGKKAA